jgi:hypothetical protein
MLVDLRKRKAGNVWLAGHRQRAAYARWVKSKRPLLHYRAGDLVEAAPGRGAEAE